MSKNPVLFKFSFILKHSIKEKLGIDKIMTTFDELQTYLNNNFFTFYIL